MQQTARFSKAKQSNALRITTTGSEDSFSIRNTIDMSVRTAIKGRKTWQKQGVVYVESFGYVLLRNSLIFGSFIMAHTSQIYYNKVNQTETYGEVWIIFYIIINTLMLADFIAAIIFYGAMNLFKAKPDYIVEAVVQLTFIVAMIWYITTPGWNVPRLSDVVKFMSITLMLRVPIIGVLLSEIHAFVVIFETAKRMLSSFMTILFSFYLFLELFNIIGQGLYSGSIEL